MTQQDLFAEAKDAELELCANEAEAAAMPPLALTDDNYYSAEADAAYMSFSQYKDWVRCPAKKFATMNEGWQDRESEPHYFIAGRLFHLMVLEPHKVAQFHIDNPEVAPRPDYTHPELKELANLHAVDLKGAASSKEKTRERLLENGVELPLKDRKLSSNFSWISYAVNAFKRQAIYEEIIRRGDHEVNVAFEFGGIWWKSKLDNVRPDDKQFDDLKGMADFSEKWKSVNDKNVKVDWYLAYDYDQQMAVYRVAAHAAYGVWMRANILGVSKESPADVSWIQFADAEDLDRRAGEVAGNIPMVMSWKSGEVEAPRCESCAYCRETKVLKAPTLGMVL